MTGSHRKVDIAIIGAGTAGMGAYRKAVAETDNVVLIEAGDYGTTCARVGCMPSKLLIAAAEAAHRARMAGTFGVNLPEPQIDGAAVMARVRLHRDRFVGHVVETVKSWPEEHRIRARARFVGPTRLALDDGTEIEAGRIVIATGSSPVMPEAFLALGAAAMTSDDVFHLNDLPASVAVFGAGVIGLELGQALARLGVRVRLFGKGGDLAQLSDPDVKAVAQDVLSDELPFLADHEADVMEPHADGSRIVWTSADGDGDEVFERVLVAVGRRPNLSDLGLEATGLDLDDRGTPCHDPATGQCGDAPIFIAGDVDSLPPLLHTASDAGRKSGSNAASFPKTHESRPATPISVTFTNPQIAVVGESWAALKDRNACFETGRVDWSDQGRATVIAENHGTTVLYGEQETGRLLGAEMVGPAVEHMAHLLAWSIDRGETVEEVLAHPFYHPCLEEGLRTALRDLNRNLGLDTTPPVPRCLDCGPGA